jgi:hypothetical protein
VSVTLAQAAAWSPNPKNPPLYIDLPVKDGQPQPDVIAKWAANAPLAMVPQYIPNLKMYKAVAIEIGTKDPLYRTNKQMHDLFDAFGVTTATASMRRHEPRVQRIEKDAPLFSPRSWRRQPAFHGNQTLRGFLRFRLSRFASVLVVSPSPPARLRSSTSAQAAGAATGHEQQQSPTRRPQSELTARRSPA